MRDAYGRFVKGNTMPETLRRKISATLTGRKKETVYFGAQSPNWRGGVCANPRYVSLLKNKRNRMKQHAPGSHTFDEWEALKIRYGNMCLCCKRTEPAISLTEDHIVPISKGGSDYIENIQPLCQSCNSTKYNKIIDYTNQPTV